MTKQISCFIVDDDPLVIETLSLLLNQYDDIKVIETANDGVGVCQWIEHNRDNDNKMPDIILMDIQMPNMYGIEATTKLKAIRPDLPIMMLTTFVDTHNIRLALNAGAGGYLIKSSKSEAMANNIRTLLSGASVLDPQVLEKLTQVSQPKHDALTPREQDIYELVGQGLSNKEIANQLYISEGTVRNNLSILLEKLECRDRTQLAIYFHNHHTS